MTDRKSQPGGNRLSGEPASEIAPEDPALFTAELRPHRSLTVDQGRTVVMLFALTSAVACVPFILLGAWPVIGSFGIDVLLLAWAFRANWHAARALETIVLTPVSLFIAKVSARGRRREWHFNPLWVRIERYSHKDFGLERFAVASRGERVEMGSFLPPEDRARFADDFCRALGEARRSMR